MRCKAHFDQAYPVADACRLAHKFPTGTHHPDDVRCKRCDAKFCDTTHLSTWCFLGRHTTHRRRAPLPRARRRAMPAADAARGRSRATCSNDGEDTSVEQSGTGEDESEEEYDDDAEDC